VVEGVTENEVVLLSLKIGLVPGNLRFEFFIFWAGLGTHVGMHVGDKQIRAAIVVKIKELDSHRAPRGLGEVLVGFFYKFFTSQVFVVMAASLHVQKENARPAFAVQVSKTRLSTPSVRFETYFCRYILKVVVPHILVKDGVFVAVRIEMAREGVWDSRVLAIRPLFIACVFADVAY